MSAVFTIGETNFDDFDDDDEEFLNEAFNFENDQLMDQITSPKNFATSSFPVTSDISGKESYSNSNDRNGLRNPLRSKESSVITFSKSGSSSRCLGPSSISCREPNRDRANAKRTGHISSNFSSEPPFKKKNCVKGNNILIAEKDMSHNSIRIVENSSERAVGTNRLLAESKSLTNNIIMNKALHCSPVISSRGTSSLSSGLRYTQNTTSSVLSPQLTNDRPGIVAQARTSLERANTLSSYSHNPANSYPPTTPNPQKESSLENGRKTESPVVAYFRRSTARKKRDNLKRFPGPAGMLPRLDPEETFNILQSPLSDAAIRKLPQFSQLFSSEHDEDFKIEPWTLMQDRVSKDFPDYSDTLATVEKKSSSHELENGKVAFLAVLIKSFKLTGTDVRTELKDPSGAMGGTLHRKVFDEHKTELGPGCGLFLKEVSVFSPSPQKHHLNITPRNVLEIFPASTERHSSQKVKEAPTKCKSKHTEKQAASSNSEIEIEQAQSFGETSFDELFEGLDDDDEMLIEAMNV